MSQFKGFYKKGSSKKDPIKRFHLMPHKKVPIRKTQQEDSTEKGPIKGFPLKRPYKKVTIRRVPIDGPHKKVPLEGPIKRSN